MAQWRSAQLFLNFARNAACKAFDGFSAPPAHLRQCIPHSPPSPVQMYSTRIADPAAPKFSMLPPPPGTGSQGALSTGKGQSLGLVRLPPSGAQASSGFKCSTLTVFKQHVPRPGKVEVLDRSVRMLSKRPYATLEMASCARRNISRTKHGSNQLVLKRRISLKCSFLKLKVNFVKGIEKYAGNVDKLVDWFIKAMKKGLQSRAFSHFRISGQVLALWGVLCFGIEKLEAKLHHIEQRNDGKDSFSLKITKTALEVLLFLKKIVLFWSNDARTGELMQQIVGSVERLAEKIDEQAEKNEKLRLQFDDMQSRIDDIEENLKKIKSKDEASKK